MRRKVTARSVDPWEVGMPLDLLMILILVTLAGLSVAYIAGLERI